MHGPGWYEEHDVELRTGVRATRLDPAGHTVELDGGERLPYRAAAAGHRRGAPPAAACPGADLDGVR